MDSLEADDQLTILNRSTEYRISKKLIRKVPYFERMLSHECLETKENKVELDFDEQDFKSFLSWIKLDSAIIDMDYVITLCDISDYFGMDYEVQKFNEYFRQKFSMEHLPTIIHQVTETSMLINSHTLNAFICCHFLRIKNSYAASYSFKKYFWLEYPVETIEYICALNLMIYSEYQVFEAIERWVNFNVDSRKCHLERLLRLVRWCYLGDKDLFEIKENELVKSSGFQPRSCLSFKDNCDCVSDRAKQHCLIIIEQLEGTDLRIIVLDSKLVLLFNRDLKLDRSISLNLLHDEHVSIIFYYSGRKAIRVDWNRNAYRFFKDTDIGPYISGTCELNVNYWSKYWRRPPSFSPFYRYKIRDKTDAGFFYATGHEESEYWLNRVMRTADKIINDSRLHDWVMYFRLTVLSDNIFILTNNLAFGKFNVRQKHFKKIELPKLRETNELEYKSLFITSSKVHADRVFLIDASTKNVFCFNITNQEWSFFGGLFIDPYPSSNSGKSFGNCPMESEKLITLTQAFLPLDLIYT
ncbi:uncharacterized protein LOC112539898 [Tetranychus urticae]|uniref:BACK domain-containing protein n=1 Tax=Tetranychus urticae TaxID=32264 RepID=T1JXM2_TETUR|nr:uncharacterized protein LOC112539898 [Tetranychus urticae]